MSFPKWMRAKIFVESDKKCKWCGRLWDSGFMLEIDHIVPLSCGGESEEKNAQLMCRECHLKKHLRDYMRAIQKGDKKRMKKEAYAVRKLKERIDEKTIYRYGFEKRKG